MKKTSKKTETNDEEKEEAYRLQFLDELISLHKAQFPRLSKELEASFKDEFDVFEEEND